uniref:Histone acetyltransferase type B catalytic subunit n=2 Tax=Ciona intestinalis TaxID=7719 RepID=F6RPW8_CIOIN
MEDIQNKLMPYICDANSAVQFKLVKSKEDLETDDGFFFPDMSHQIFGEKEQIFGFTDLKLRIYYTASSLQIHTKLLYGRKINPEQFDGVKADDIMKSVREVLPANVIENVDDFSKKLDGEPNFKPFGEIIYNYTRQQKGKSTKRNFEIYKADMTNPNFKEYHQRIESFILWFIDAACFIDSDDDKWDFYVVFEKCTEGGITSHLFVGYSTCYRFYAYPDKIRPRISQVLVLPPYQRQGHCTELITAIYQQYVPKAAVLDITAEDPSENFQRVRDFIDSKNCLKLPEFQDSKLGQKFSKEMRKAAQEKYKINRRQARRVYEILRLRITPENDDVAFTKYRLAVKSRLNEPIYAHVVFLTKINESLRKKSHLLPASLVPPKEERLLMLQREFETCLHEYKKVITRLDISA